MRILIIGLSILNAPLRELGHQIYHIHHTAGENLTLEHPVGSASLLAGLEQTGFKPDLFCLIDDGNLPILIDPEKVPFPSIYYSIDSYCNPWHFSYAHGFDLTLVAQKDFLPLFAQSGLEAQWFPLFCYNEYTSEWNSRDIPVSFVGTLKHKNNPSRFPFLESFRRYQPLVALSGAYPPIFTRSKIVLNQTAFGELNFRVFEAMACGAAVLMEKCENGFSEIFKEGENILPGFCRGDGRQAASIAAEWLQKDKALLAVAENGREHVLKYHSSRVRAKTLSGYADKLLSSDAHKLRLSHVKNRTNLVRAAYGMIASELSQKEMETHKQFYLNLAKNN